mmetsp:Transcript_62325/g.136162  ORF Transcript_62325/g.136162 Transcript_62325/m.136162 type:complete len:100 (+) Transcript_62325:985-1284(+)
MSATCKWEEQGQKKSDVCCSARKEQNRLLQSIMEGSSQEASKLNNNGRKPIDVRLSRSSVIFVFFETTKGGARASGWLGYEKKMHRKLADMARPAQEDC